MREPTTILLVEDDTAIREALAGLLTDEGYRVIRCADGFEALQVLSRATRPMLILLDLQMPRLSGYDVLQWLIARPHLRGGHALLVFSAHAASLPPGYQQICAQLHAWLLDKGRDLPRLLAILQEAEAHLPLRPTDEDELVS